ncbi:MULTISPECIES: hypothetical protein [Pyrobaculum]|uniref:Uncharacterized protein n=1 Tax=Pyrobaculum aerophilum TaxID=13773 RepID=A0A371QYC3_9CREN|nr:hypothetical protein [Pyrobaculum aerophilum]RFA93091.1 hypothetical protein CGL51_13385 [Pyrobaculum aerophilum]RFA95701.1 hypothetical protein CGL52_12475 [Pyrobaculum aerophilum]
MEKRDCLIAVIENCGGQPAASSLKDLLRQARIKARKLVIISACGKLGEVFPIVRQIASDNMDFPVRHYHQVEIPQAAALENCAAYEVIKV